MKFSKREINLIIAVAVTAVLFLYYQFIYTPVASQITILKTNISSARDMLIQNSQKLQVLTGLKKSRIEILPKDILIEKLIVHATGSRNVKILSIMPSIAGDSITVEIYCMGELDGIKNFLKSFEELNLPLSVDRMEIGPSGASLGMRLILSSYGMK